MKDAFGGVFMLRILIIFFVVFVSFMTVAVSYVRVYRIKNNVISMLERDDSDDAATDVIEPYLAKVNYQYTNNENVKGECSNRINSEKKQFEDSTVKGSNIRGVCVVPYISEKDGIYYYHYQVTAYIVLDFPLFNFGTVLPISGETRTLMKSSS